jgi:hypothetical protein
VNDKGRYRQLRRDCAGRRDFLEEMLLNFKVGTPANRDPAIIEANVLYHSLPELARRKNLA